MLKKYLSILFLFFSAQSMVADYGWVQDLVGIKEESFNYVEGSDPDLEKYTTNPFFTNVTIYFIITHIFYYNFYFILFIRK